MPGLFTDAIYQAGDFQGQFRCRVGLDTLSLQLQGFVNGGASGNYRDHPYIKSRGSRRSPEPFMRAILVKFTSTRPAGYVAGTLLRLPWLLAFPYSVFVVGDVGTYKGNPIELVQKLDEYAP